MTAGAAAISVPHSLAEQFACREAGDSVIYHTSASKESGRRHDDVVV